MSRRGAEFENRIKDQEKIIWHKKNPGNAEAKLEIHHIMPIEEGLKRGVPKEALSSQQNAVAVTPEFHQEIHNKTDQETYNVIALCLLKIWARLF